MMANCCKTMMHLPRENGSPKRSSSLSHQNTSNKSEPHSQTRRSTTDDLIKPNKQKKKKLTIAESRVSKHPPIATSGTARATL